MDHNLNLYFAFRATVSQYTYKYVYFNPIVLFFHFEESNIVWSYKVEVYT